MEILIIVRNEAHMDLQDGIYLLVQFANKAFIYIQGNNLCRP